MGQVERRNQAGFRFVAARPDASPPLAPESLDVAERQRQSAAARSRNGLSGRRKRNALEQAGYLVRNGERYRRDWKNRRQNERPLRIRSRELLDDRHKKRWRVWIQHRD